MDADIEKSSSTNLETALVIPLQSAALVSSDRVDKKGQDIAESNHSVKAVQKGIFFIFSLFETKYQFYNVFRKKRVGDNVFDNKLWN